LGGFEHDSPIDSHKHYIFNLGGDLRHGFGQAGQKEKSPAVTDDRKNILIKSYHIEGRAASSFAARGGFVVSRRLCKGALFLPLAVQLHQFAQVF
jgi:hypothetical protein